MLALRWTRHRTAPARLVGRERELGTLEAALDALDGGEPGVRGARGRARDRQDAAARRAARAGRGRAATSCSSGAAAEFERDLPFSVWVDALDAYVASQDLERHERVGRRARAPSSARSCPRCGAANGGARGASPTSATAPTARCAGCSGCWPSDQPLVLVLDDLHWSDGASIELIAALLRRGPTRRSCSRSPSGPARPPQRLRAALAGAARAAGSSSASSARPRRRSCSATLDADGGRRDLPPRRRQPVLPRAARPRGGERRPTRARSATRRRAAGGVPPAVAAALAEELGVAVGRRRARCSRRRPWPASRSSPTSRRRSPSWPSRTALDALDELLDLDLVRPTAGAAPLRLPPPARAPRRLRVARAAAGGSPRTRARPRRWRRAAPTPPSAPTTSSSRPRQGDEEAIELLLEAGREAAAARARPRRRAGSRRRCGCSRAATPSARSRCAWRSPRRCARVGELERCRATLLEAIDAAPARGGRRRVELTALCAAVEHWLGRHDEAHRRLDARVGRAARPLDAPRRRRCRSSSRSTASTSSTSSRRSRWAAARSRRRAPLGDRALIAAAASALCLGEAAAGRDRRRARAPRGGARPRRPALRRRAGAAAGGALLPRLGRELPRALRRRRSRTSTAASRSPGRPARAGCSSR